MVRYALLSLVLLTTLAGSAHSRCRHFSPQRVEPSAAGEHRKFPLLHRILEKLRCHSQRLRN